VEKLAATTNLKIVKHMLGNMSSTKDELPFSLSETERKKNHSIKGADLTFDNNEKETTLNVLGRLYNFNVFTRYIIYVAPLALVLAIPIVLSQMKVIEGSIAGTIQKSFWIWMEIGGYS
jgi:hypothetical protein